MREDGGVKQQRFAREVSTGVVVGVVIGVLFTWWFAAQSDDRPSLDRARAATSSVSKRPRPGGGKVIGGGANNADTTPRAPIGTAESTLAKVWESITQLYTQGESYRAVTLEALGLQAPSYGFMPGDRPSLAPREISVFTPVPEQMYLAVRENNQCVWMRDRGHGTEVTRAASPMPCAAATPPSNALWEPITTN